jgi:2-haloacid dehalogenase
MEVMSRRALPPVLLLDSLQTCLSLEPLREPLVRRGFERPDLDLWFARALREAFAREVVGEFQPFAETLEQALDTLARGRGLSLAATERSSLIERFVELPAHPDVRPALELARGYGARVFVLTNGSAATTKVAFHASGLGDLVERFISIDEVGHAKPAREVYLHAAAVAGVTPAQCVLVAAHGWDLRGALHAGMQAAFVERNEPLAAELAPRVIASGMALDVVLDDVLERVRIPPRSRARAAVRLGATALAGLVAAVGFAAAASSVRVRGRPTT